MLTLDTPKPGTPIIKLLLVHTTIPSQALAVDFCLPTFAAVSLKGTSLLVQVKRRDPEGDFWDSDEPSVPTGDFELKKSDILLLSVGGTWKLHYSRFPTATFSIRDPFGVVASLEITFVSTDANNP